VLSVGCRINSFSEVEESVLFERVKIGRRARLRKCIIDKDVEIPAGVHIGFDAQADRRRFFVTQSGLVVIPKRAKLEDILAGRDEDVPSQR
jgi:glucose-1-phosphate adenylyltransferase